MNNLINENNLKMWAKIGTRATFGLASLELAKSINNLIIITGDVSTSAGLDRFKKKYPEKYIDVGIAEQNMIGVAAGLSSEGFNVVTTTFSPFQTARCCEQIKVCLGYMKNKITMVGLASGLTLGTLGYTHCSIEDVAMIRGIPNISIVSPADSCETVKALIASLNHKTSVYLRLTGGSISNQIYFKDYNFEIGKSVEIKTGEDIAIIACGAMVHECVKVSDILKSKNINSTITNMHTIKPIDTEALNHICKKYKLVVTVEEHNIIGGLGSAVSEYVSCSTQNIKHLIIGIPDRYSRGGDYNFLKNHFGLEAESISKIIIQSLEKKNS